MDQSPAQWSLLISNGFQGSNNPALADKLLRWNPDLNPGLSPGFATHFLLNADVSHRYWTPLGDASLPNDDESLLFLRHQAAFLRTQSSHPAWTITLPWTP